MTDSGVETVLREIKDRVRAEQARANGASGDSGGRTLTRAGDPLARVRANLIVADRTWNKLPPVASFNRRGWKARFEVWLKRQLKRTTDWYVFEQINFNGAVNGALQATTGILEHSLNEQRVCHKQLALEISEQRVVLDRARRALETRIDELSARLEELRTAQLDVQGRAADMR